MTAATGLETAAAILTGRTAPAAPRAGRNSFGKSPSPIAPVGPKSFREGFEPLINQQIESQMRSPEAQAAASTTAQSRGPESTESSFANSSFKEVLSNSAESGLHNNLARAVFDQNGLALANASAQPKASGADAALLSAQSHIIAKQPVVALAEDMVAQQGAAEKSSGAQASTKSKDSANMKAEKKHSDESRSAGLAVQSSSAPELAVNINPVSLPAAHAVQPPATFSGGTSAITDTSRPKEIFTPAAAWQASGANAAPFIAGRESLTASKGKAEPVPASRTGVPAAPVDSNVADETGEGKIPFASGNGAQGLHVLPPDQLPIERSRIDLAAKTDTADAAKIDAAKTDGAVPDGIAAAKSPESIAAQSGSELARAIGGAQSEAGSVRTRGAQSSPSSPGTASLREGNSIAAMQIEPVSGSVHSTLMRETFSPVSLAGERSGGAVAAGSSEGRNPFAALDSEPGQPAATWTHTSARQVEAGYQDPALGWVSVRADATANGLHASLVPASTDAAQSLGSHLAGLNSFLAEHHGSAVTASVAEPAAREAFGGFNGQGSGSGQQSPQDNTARQEAGSGFTDSAPRSAMSETTGPAAAPIAAGTAATTVATAGAHSGRISVMA